MISVPSAFVPLTLVVVVVVVLLLLSHFPAGAFVLSSQPTPTMIATAPRSTSLDECPRRLRVLRDYDYDYDYDYDDDDGGGGSSTIGRREAISRSVAAMIASSSSSSLVVGARPSPARAASSAVAGIDAGRMTSDASSSSSRVSSPSALSLLCDPSVSTWTRTYDDDDDIVDGTGTAKTRTTTTRTVHILGTAHVSASSAELAGRMVRHLRPDVVFVELDAKRAGRAMPGGGGGGVGGGGRLRRAPGGGVAGNDGTTTTTTTTTTSVVASSPGEASSAAGGGGGRWTNPFDVESRLVDAGSKVVGDSVKSMYDKLEREGYKAGDEFATSVREGLAIGSTIVLGDRDVEVTLRRLTRAIVRTDIRKLLSPDSDVERSIEGLLPEGMRESLKRASGGNDIGDGTAAGATGMGTDAYIDKRDFNDFVETMKAKENIKKIMSALRATAPEIYEAMVAERDVYMGRGIDELGLNLIGRSSSKTVAVVGMAHVDGIERYLASRGWTETRYPCPIIR